MTKAEKLINWINEYQMPDSMGAQKRSNEAFELAKKGIMTIPITTGCIQTDIGLGVRNTLVLEFLKRMSDEQLEEIIG